MNNQNPLSGSDAAALAFNERSILAKCEYFVDTQVWPLHFDLNYEGWLSNFKQDEKEYALQLLNGLIYFSEKATDALFVTAVQSLSGLLHTAGTPYMVAQLRWQSFIDSALFTIVTGESPNPTDSGFLFMRKTRQILEIPESQCMYPETAIKEVAHSGIRPIIFVDDFVGSGNQFISTWTRQYEISPGRSISFAELSQTVRGLRFFYCPLVCTALGKKRIADKCSGVELCPAHVIPEEYSALHPASVLWPERLRGGAVNFVAAASRRAGIPDCNGGINDWRGFWKLGLTVAFQHSVPDATLPLLYWDKNGWTPLRRRT